MTRGAKPHRGSKGSKEKMMMKKKREEEEKEEEEQHRTPDHVDFGAHNSVCAALVRLGHVPLAAPLTSQHVHALHNFNDGLEWIRLRFTAARD